MNLVCEYCQGEIHLYNSRGKHQVRYCSPVCRKAATRDRYRLKIGYKARRSFASCTGEEGIPEGEDLEFALAMDKYKRERNRPFPTAAEVLAVAKSLGYRKHDVQVPTTEAK